MDSEDKNSQKGTKYVSGPGGICVCPRCGTTKARTDGKPCTEEICPECGAKMIME